MVFAIAPACLGWASVCGRRRFFAQPTLRLACAAVRGQHTNLIPLAWRLDWFLFLCTRAHNFAIAQGARPFALTSVVTEGCTSCTTHLSDLRCQKQPQLLDELHLQQHQQLQQQQHPQATRLPLIVTRNADDTKGCGAAKRRDQKSAIGRDQPTNLRSPDGDAQCGRDNGVVGSPPAVEQAPAGGEPEGSARVASLAEEAKHLLEGLATHSNSATHSLEGLATQSKSAAVDSTEDDLGDGCLLSHSEDVHHHLFGNVTTISERLRVFLNSSCTKFGSMSFVGSVYFLS